MTTHELADLGDVSLHLRCGGSGARDTPRLVVRFALPDTDVDSVTVTLRGETLLLRGVASAETRRNRGIIAFEHDVELPLLAHADAATLATNWDCGMLDVSVDVDLKTLAASRAQMQSAC